MITITHPIFNPTPEMLATYYQMYKHYRGLLQHFHIIWVDDYSTEPYEIPFDYPINFTLAKITEDKAYNIGGAKNLGLHVADTEWVLQTDSDHILTPPMASMVLSMKKEPGNVYHFKRTRIKNDGSAEARHPHANSYLIRKEDFWTLGGFDEDMSGPNGYGFEDALMTTQIKKKMKDNLVQHITLNEYEAFKTAGINRDTRRNLGLWRQKESQGDYKNGPVLRFTWEIADRRRM